MGRHKKVSSNIKIPSLESVPKNPFQSWSSKKFDTHDFEIDTCCTNTKNTIKNVSFVDKYSVKKHIIGRKREIEQITNFLTSFEKNILFVYGPNGCGKTSMVKHIIKQNTSLNMFYSDSTIQRNKIYFEDVIYPFIDHHINDKNGLCFVFDEVDILSNLEWSNVLEFVKKYSNKSRKKIISDAFFPIVFIIKNIKFSKISEVLKKSEIVRISGPTQQEFIEFIKNICFFENIKITVNDMKKIIKNAGSDIRKLISHIEMIKKYPQGQKIPIDSFLQISRKECEYNIYEGTEVLFKKDHCSLEDSIPIFEKDPSVIPAMIHENFHRYSLRNADNDSSIEKSICYADILQRVMFDTSNWNLNETYGIVGVCTPVALSKLHSQNYFDDPVFSSTLSKISLGLSHKNQLNEININLNNINFNNINSIFIIRKMIMKCIISKKYEVVKSLFTKYNLNYTHFDKLLKIITYNSEEFKKGVSTEIAELKTFLKKNT